MDAGSETATATGTRGVIYLMDFCGECRSCALGFTNQCTNKRGGVGFNKDSGYGPYVLVNENVFFAHTPPCNSRARSPKAALSAFMPPGVSSGHG